MRRGTTQFSRLIVGFAAAALALAWSAGARALDDRWGWTYCAPPYAPGCIEPGDPRPPFNDVCKKAVDA